MHASRVLTLAVSGFAIAACSPFASKPSVEVSTSDVNLSSRWHATLATPAALADALQMTGSASMALGSNSGNTKVGLSLGNAPSGVYGWAVHRGQCGADDGVFGPVEAYEPIGVGIDGRAAASATIPLETPTRGHFFVSVRVSTAKGERVVACGNLVPPTQYADREALRARSDVAVTELARLETNGRPDVRLHAVSR